jgi:hypothetical protein
MFGLNLGDFLGGTAGADPADQERLGAAAALLADYSFSLGDPAQNSLRKQTAEASAAIAGVGGWNNSSSTGGGAFNTLTSPPRLRRRMRRVCVGTPVHSEQTDRLRCHQTAKLRCHGEEC